MARVSFTEEQRRSIYLRDARRCQKCGRGDSLDIHHISAVIDGGLNEEKNLTILCGACHQEWHIVEDTTTISFVTWRDLPPIALLLKSILNSQLEGVSYDDWRAALIGGFLHVRSTQIEEARQPEALEPVAWKRQLRPSYLWTQVHKMRGDRTLICGAELPHESDVAIMLFGDEAEVQSKPCRLCYTRS